MVTEVGSAPSDRANAVAYSQLSAEKSPSYCRLVAMRPRFPFAAVIIGATCKKLMILSKKDISLRKSVS